MENRPAIRLFVRRDRRNVPHTAPAHLSYSPSGCRMVCPPAPKRQSSTPGSPCSTSPAVPCLAHTLAPYLANQLPLLVHADVETCGCPLDTHAAPKGVCLHDELGWGEEQGREGRRSQGLWDRAGTGVETPTMHPDAGHCRHIISGNWTRESPKIST